MRITFTYKTYPGADDLTKRSEKVARLTHPTAALFFAALIAFALYMITQIPMLLVIGFPAAAILLIILLRKAKKNSEKKLDAEYASRK